MAPRALRIWCGAAAALLNLLALVGWAGTAYAAAQLGYYALGRVDHPPVLPFVIGAAVLMATLGGTWRARDILAAEIDYRTARAIYLGKRARS